MLGHGGLDKSREVILGFGSKVSFILIQRFTIEFVPPESAFCMQVWEIVVFFPFFNIDFRNQLTKISRLKTFDRPPESAPTSNRVKIPHAS